MNRLATMVATASAVLTVAVAPAANQQQPSQPEQFHASGEDDPKPIAPFAERALDWLASAQAPNGGWGAGSHSRQDVRDPHAVAVDPATSAFAALALVRAGSTLNTGPYRENVSRALEYLLEAAESHPDAGTAITDVRGTQPQAKLGQNIDVSMTAQFLTRILKETHDDPALRKRVEDALDKCLAKLARAQQSDGSFNNGGWAPVLQSAMANSAFEMAASAGRAVDAEVLKRSRDYQDRNVDEDGSVRTEAAAGIGLYSIASSQRALAADVRQMHDRLDEARRDGKIDKAAPVTTDNLKAVGYSAEEAESMATTYRKFQSTTEMLSNDDVLAGFGNNGGEEFLSYMMTAESLAAAGGESWDEWHAKMSNRLEAVQNTNGSWSGHHCITSPVFSTSAVVLTLTADRDLDLIQKTDAK